MTATPLNPQILGRAESALRALLDRILARSGHSYHHWVALSLTAGNGARIDCDELVALMTSALKIDAGCRTAVEWPTRGRPTAHAHSR